MPLVLKAQLRPPASRKAGVLHHWTLTRFPVTDGSDDEHLTKTDKSHTTDVTTIVGVNPDRQWLSQICELVRYRAATAGGRGLELGIGLERARRYITASNAEGRERARERRRAAERRAAAAVASFLAAHFFFFLISGFCGACSSRLWRTFSA